MRTWWQYHEAFAPLEERELLRRPVVPASVRHNGHIYYVLVKDLQTRTEVLAELNRADVNAVFHYVPLHSSEGGRKYGRAHGELPHSEAAADRLIRLPIWSGMSDGQVARVVDTVAAALHAGVRTAG
jgi:dTDP-4-amino-4,6-dideoxygalactose transaminase